MFPDEHHQSDDHADAAYQRHPDRHQPEVLQNQADDGGDDPQHGADGECLAQIDAHGLRCRFFAWFALYSMWVYSTPAIAEHVYGATDPASAEYAMAGDKVGELFSIYNFVAMLFALLLIPIARHLGRKMTHALCLCLGGAGLVSLYLLNSTGMMVFSMIGIGIAWASILAMPYAILSDSLPADKMGTYMGIFNFFITIPQITNGIIHGWIVRNVYHGHAVFALLTGGVFLFFAAAAVSLVKEKKFSRKV